VWHRGVASRRGIEAGIVEELGAAV
jgi:hypothetical protein